MATQEHARTKQRFYGVMILGAWSFISVASFYFFQFWMSSKRIRISRKKKKHVAFGSPCIVALQHFHLATFKGRSLFHSYKVQCSKKCCITHQLQSTDIVVTLTYNHHAACFALFNL